LVLKLKFTEVSGEADVICTLDNDFFDDDDKGVLGGACHSFLY
jgi:hypothetical protein